MSLSLKGVLLLPPCTELLLAYSKFLISNFLQHSSKLLNPTILELIYEEGFSNEYLTPAWAAKLMTTSGRYFLNILNYDCLVNHTFQI